MDPSAQQGNPNMSREEYMQNQMKVQQMEAQRDMVLASILSTGGKERLDRISIVNPQKARKIGDVLLQNAQAGRLTGKLDEKQLIKFIETFNEKTEKKTRVTIKRREFSDDESSESESEGDSDDDSSDA